MLSGFVLCRLAGFVLLGLFVRARSLLVWRRASDAPMYQAIVQFRAVRLMVYQSAAVTLLVVAHGICALPGLC
jgi:hypothetical protein